MLESIPIELKEPEVSILIKLIQPVELHIYLVVLWLNVKNQGSKTKINTKL